MKLLSRAQRWRDWFPVPQSNGRINLGRWLLLEGNRIAVTGALLSFVFVSLMVIGTLWTFEMQRLITETPAVQTILNTFLSGIILLVSIVVSINSIVLSHDITSVDTQEKRIKGVMEFRREVGQLTDSNERLSDPGSFLELMAEVISHRTEALRDAVDGSDEELIEDIEKYIERVAETVERLDRQGNTTEGAEFGVLWHGLEVDYGPYVDDSRTIRGRHGSKLTEDVEEQLDELVRTLQLFATGKEYFKTLYYTQEISELSRSLLLVALPSILVTASAILAVNAQLLPRTLLFGLPPLLAFVATVFTVSLAPFIVLTAYMLRLATVAQRTAAAGPFSLK